MAISGMSSVNFHASSQQALQSLAHHKYGGHHGRSLSDVDTINSSATSAPSKTGTIGSKIDVTA